MNLRFFIFTNFRLPTGIVAMALCAAIGLLITVNHSSDSSASQVITAPIDWTNISSDFQNPIIPAPPPPPPNNYGFSANELVGKDPTLQSQELDGIKATGVSWVRIDMEWYVVQPSSADSYDWSRYDQVINAINQHGLKVLAILDYAPVWAAAAGCWHSPNHKCAPGNYQAFANYAAAAAERYKSLGVSDWEIWNEPNTRNFWYPGVNVASYAALLKAAYPAIKQVDPGATVITAGLNSTPSANTIYSLDFISQLYADGAGPYFDAIGVHPYSYPYLPSVTNDWSGWTQMLKIHDIATAEGDGTKKIWMTEIGAATGGPHPISDSFQAQLVDQAISLRNSYAWAGPLFWYDYQDLGNNRYASVDFYGLVRTNGVQKPAYASFTQAIKQ